MVCCLSNDGLILENEGLRGILWRKRVNLSNNNSNIESIVKVLIVKIGSVGILINSIDSDYIEVVFFKLDKLLCDRWDGFWNFGIEVRDFFFYL